MDEISFQEEPAAPVFAPAKKPLMIRLVLSTGIVATDEEATYALLGVAGIFILLAIIFGVSAFKSASPPAQTFKEGQSVLAPPQGATQ